MTMTARQQADCDRDHASVVICALQNEQHCASDTIPEVDYVIERLVQSLVVLVHATCKSSKVAVMNVQPLQMKQHLPHLWQPCLTLHNMTPTATETDMTAQEVQCT